VYGDDPPAGGAVVAGGDVVVLVVAAVELVVGATVVVVVDVVEVVEVVVVVVLVVVGHGRIPCGGVAAPARPGAPAAATAMARTPRGTTAHATVRLIARSWSSPSRP
jgi:hypothetical protein